MHAGTQIIETDRLLLRPFTLQDAESMLANWINDPAVQSEYGEPVYGSMTAVEALLKKWIAAYRDKDYYRWAIILKGREACIGQIAFCHVDTSHHQAELEYCIGQMYQSNGYATEALRAVIRFSFAHTWLHRLQAFHRGRNAGSGSVLRKAQMIREGTFKDSYYYPDTGEFDDKVYYGIVRDSAG